jgi:hypothetical protein
VGHSIVFFRQKGETAFLQIVVELCRPGGGRVSDARRVPTIGGPCSPPEFGRADTGTGCRRSGVFIKERGEALSHALQALWKTLDRTRI